jgi:hypothetical protein
VAALDRRRYFTSLLFRLLLVLLALMLSVRAIYVLQGGFQAWCLAGLFCITAAALQIRPLIVPSPGKMSAVYTPAPAFFLAALYLIPAGPLVVSIAFAVALSGLITGTRPHKILLQLSITTLAFGACSYYLKLGPRSADPQVPPPELVATELLLGAVVLVAQLLLRSIAIRLERGDETPHWGAFQPQAMVEALYCLALAVPISVLARIHLGLLAVVYLYVGLTWWFMERYRRHVRTLSQDGSVEEQGRWAA